MKIRNNIAVSDTGFVFNPGTGESFNLNPAGIEIFEMLRLEKSNEEILEAILAKYDIEKDMAEKDLDDFMHHLKTYKILDSDE